MQNSSRKIVVLFPVLTGDQMSRIEDAAAKNGFEVFFCESKEDAESRIGDAEVFFGTESDLIRAGNDLKWVCSTTAGIGHLTDALKGRDIVLTNSSGAFGVTISEHIIMVTLELMRQRMKYLELLEKKEWTNMLRTHSILGSRITLLGTGDIGRETAIRLRAFSPETIVGVNRHGDNPDGLFDRIVPLSDIESILPQTDLLISSLPSTDETRDLLTDKRLRMLPSDAYLVNVGRGDVLDQKAIEKILREGLLGGAALDVFRQEPIPDDDSIWDCPGLLITTHCSGSCAMNYTVDKIVEMFVNDLNNYVLGKPLEKLVDLNAGY